MDIPQTIPFTDEDRTHCIAAVHRMCYLADTARHKGVLALQNAVKDEPCFFLRQAIEIVTEGVDEESTYDILTTLLQAQQYPSVELLERVIYMEGALSILNSVPPRMIEVRLSYMLGENFLAKGLYPPYAEWTD